MYEEPASHVRRCVPRTFKGLTPVVGTFLVAVLLVPARARSEEPGAVDLLLPNAALLPAFERCAPATAVSCGKKEKESRSRLRLTEPSGSNEAPTRCPAPAPACAASCSCNACNECWCCWYCCRGGGCSSVTRSFCRVSDSFCLRQRISRSMYWMSPREKASCPAGTAKPR